MTVMRASPIVVHAIRMRCLVFDLCQERMMGGRFGSFHGWGLGNSLSCMVRLDATLRMLKDMKGMSLGLINACPHNRGWNRNNSVMANAILFENQCQAMK